MVEGSVEQVVLKWSEVVGKVVGKVVGNGIGQIVRNMVGNMVGKVVASDRTWSEVVGSGQI